MVGPGHYDVDNAAVGLTTTSRSLLAAPSRASLASRGSVVRMDSFSSRTQREKESMFGTARRFHFYSRGTPGPGSYSADIWAADQPAAARPSSPAFSFGLSPPDPMGRIASLLSREAMRVPHPASYGVPNVPSRPELGSTMG